MDQKINIVPGSSAPALQAWFLEKISKQLSQDQYIFYWRCFISSLRLAAVLHSDEARTLASPQTEVPYPTQAEDNLFQAR